MSKLLKLADTSCRKEIRKVLEYIDKNLEKNITCEMMAKYVYMNGSYFSRLFKNEVGMSFSEYLLKAKIERHDVFNGNRADCGGYFEGRRFLKT